MITIDKLDKSFDDVQAVNNVTLNIRENQVFGLVGTNGAGKSTLMRLIAGVLKSDSGQIRIDGEPIYDNIKAKEKLFFVSDDQYFLPNSNAEDMKRYYVSIYKKFDPERFDKLVADFGLDPKRNISNYSKGMKKQLAIICGLCANTPYLLLDETFDGLDPVMRQGTKSLFANDMDERNLTIIISSHNLRELEDICDCVGLLHKGGLLLSENLDNMKLGLKKIQCVFEEGTDEAEVLKGLKVLTKSKRGRLYTITARASRDELDRYFENKKMIFYEVLPLTLEEIFISETEAVGYDIKKLIIG